MIVYLVQHGEALSSEQDPLRPLSDKGMADVRRMADYLKAHAGVSVHEVLHSGKERSEQTAVVLAEALNAPLGADHHLKPGDDPDWWAQHLKTRQKHVMLVGHLPHLERLADLLLAGKDGLSLVNFRNAGVVCLQRNGDGVWQLGWILTPAILPAAKP